MPASNPPRHRRIWRGLLPLLLLGLFGLPAPPAMAADKEQRQLQAREQFRRAEVAYRLGRFQAALKSYRQAYELDQQPAFIFNIAQCQRQLGRWRKAEFHYRLYLSDWRRHRRGTPPPHEQEVKRLIIDMEKQAGSKARGPAARHPAGMGTPGTKPTVQKSSEERPPHRLWRRAVGWSTVAAGGASLIASVVLGSLVQSTEEEYRRARDREGTYADLTNIQGRGENYQAAHLATLISGGVLVAAGASLLIWDLLDRGGERQVSLAPLAGPGLIGLTSCWEFGGP